MVLFNSAKNVLVRVQRRSLLHVKLLLLNKMKENMCVQVKPVGQSEKLRR